MNTSHHANKQRFSPRTGTIVNGNNNNEGSPKVMNRYSRDTGCPSPLTDVDPRKRHFSGSTQRPPSILSGLKGLMMRPRSESLGTQLMKKPLRKVQIVGCKLDSVYDLRENEEDEKADFYDDESAFRRPRSNSSDFLILRKTSRPLSVDVVGLVDAQSDPYRQYMKVVDCYELAPNNGNVVLFDKNLSIARGFEALCLNGIGAGLVWDAEKQKIISIVTFTDFFLHLQSSDSFTDQTIAAILSGNNLVRVKADVTVFDACEEFTLNRVHRVVVVDEQSGDVQYLLTIKRVLQAIHKQNRSLHFAQWLTYPIRSTKIGKWDEKIHTVTLTDSVTTAIKLMLGFRLSSLPVVNEKGQAVEVLRKNDIAQALLYQDNPQEFFAHSTVSSIIPQRDPPVFLTAFTPVAQVLDAILNQEHSRSMYILDKSQSPMACVSLSDILHHLIYDDSPFQKPQLS